MQLVLTITCNRYTMHVKLNYSNSIRYSFQVQSMPILKSMLNCVLIIVLNGSIPTGRTPAATSCSTFTHTVVGTPLQTSIWVDFQTYSTAFRAATCDTAVNFFDSSWRQLWSSQLFGHALFQNTFPKCHSGTIISHLVVNGFLSCCLAILVGFGWHFDSFCEPISFEISLFEIFRHLLISQT